MADDGERARATSARGPDGLGGRVGLATLFVAAIVALSAWNLPRLWPSAFESGLPEEVVRWVRFGMAVGAVNLLWGLWLIGQALRGAAGFARAFAIWHGFNVVAIGVSTYLILTGEHFVFQISSHLWPLAQAVAGIVLAVLLLRAPAAPAAAPAARPPALVYVINGFIAAVLGAATGAGAGLLVGDRLAAYYEVGCFEGACGYFVAAFGLLGLVAGAIVGLVVGLRRTGRRGAA